MGELISESWRTARKRHECDLCGREITVGEKYYHTVQKDYGEMSTFRTHEKCEFIFMEIRDYVDPNDGMSEEDFMDALYDIRHDFICPDCDNFLEDDTYGGFCDCDEVDEVYKCLQKYELYKVRDGCFNGWRMRKRSQA